MIVRERSLNLAVCASSIRRRSTAKEEEEEEKREREEEEGGERKKKKKELKEREKKNHQHLHGVPAGLRTHGSMKPFFCGSAQFSASRGHSTARQ